MKRGAVIGAAWLVALACGGSGPTSIAPAPTDEDGGNGSRTDAGASDATLGDGGVSADGQSTTCKPHDIGAVQMGSMDLFVLVDRSASTCDVPNKNRNCNDKDSKWQGMRDAVDAIVTSKRLARTTANLVQFPTTPPTAPQDCDPTLYQTPSPAGVILPDTGHALVGELDSLSNNPNRDTPMKDAVDGIFTAAEASLAASDSSKSGTAVVVLFVTDASPSGCSDDGDVAPSATVAQSHPRIPMFVVGAGDLVNDLTLLAQGGNTGSPFMVTNANASSADQNVVPALNEFRGKLISCDIPIPEADREAAKNGAGLSGESVAGTAHSPLVFRGPDCRDKQGFMLDDPAAPTKVMLCQATCDAVRSDPNTRVTISTACSQ